mgnify:CR=1 FL=1
MTNLEDIKELFQTPDAGKVLEWLEEENTTLLKELLSTGTDDLINFLELKVNAGLKLRMTLQNRTPAMSNIEILSYVTKEIYAPAVGEDQASLTDAEEEVLQQFYKIYIDED